MLLIDVNILIYAHRDETTDHPASRDWVEDAINSGSAYGVSELVLSGFIRVVTHPKVFERPTPLAVALDFVNSKSCCAPVTPQGISFQTPPTRPWPSHRGATGSRPTRGFYASHAIVYWAGRVYPLTVAHDAFYPSSAVIVADS